MKKAIRVIIVLVIVAAAIIGYSLYKKNQNKPEWRLDSVSNGTIREEVTASGTLNPSTKVEIGTEISGKILKLYKDFNDNVRRGELLAKLDTENLEASLESARSDVTRAQISVQDAKIDLDLQNELFSKEMGTSYDRQKAQNRYDQALQSLANAQSSLKKAEKNLANAIITSPIDGIVISRNVEEGQTVAASMSSPTLFIIADNLRKMQIDADVDEADIGKIRVGEAVEFTVDAFAGERFKGSVQQVRLSPNTNQNVVTYTVIISVDNPQLKLLPGMTANVTIVVQERENVSRIPETAIRFRPGKELWEQFGLKWDNSITARPALATANQTVSGKPDSSQARTMPDSIRTRLQEMTPEQRAAFRDAAQSGRRRDSQTQLQSSSQTAFTPGADISIKQNRSRVWILQDGKPVSVDIVTGLSDGRYVELISGLEPEQQIITGVNYTDPKQAAAANKSILNSGGGFRP